MERHKSLLFFAAGAATVYVASTLSAFRNRSTAKVLPSPVEKSGELPASQSSRLPYPPSNFIPGARDVDTPYGTIRVYEWGPEDAARKVLLIHGISGSCVVLLSLAQTLVARGYRVMLPDLFGRGWSGGPADLPYDGRLYASHILMCLASSPIPWTGGHTFCLVGYSLGGAIVADFASHFLDLVQDLVLIAPGGLMKSDWKGSLLYSGLIPESLMTRVVRRRLQASETPTKAPLESLDPTFTEAEAAAEQASSFAERISGIDGDAVVDWQIRHNACFIPAFVSTIRFAPLRDRHKRWSKIGSRISELKQSRTANPTSDTPHRGARNFSSGSVLLILGKTDPIIRAPEVVPEAEKALGADNLQVKVYEAGHEVGMSKGSEIGELLWERWHA